MAAVLNATQLATGKQIVGYLTNPPSSLNLPPSVAKGLPSNSAIAAGGNAGQESGYNATIWGDGKVSFGLWQFQVDRLEGVGPPMGLKNWCAANNLDYTSVEGQSYFFLYDLANANGAPNIVAWLTDTSNNGQPKRSLATLTADICQFDERPGNPMLDDRISYSNQLATYLQVLPVVPAPAPTPVIPVSPATPVISASDALQLIITAIETAVGGTPSATLAEQILAQIAIAAFKKLTG